jgi:uncharacterized OB-fold protein
MSEGDPVDMQGAGRPVPLPDEITAGFWDSIRAHRLSLQRCASCSRFNHPPTLSCRACGSDDVVYETVSGRGTVYSYTVMRDAPAPGFRDHVPFLIGLVELVEQPRLLIVTNLIDVDLADVRIGLDVEVAFETISEDCTLPQFRPAAT